MSSEGDAKQEEGLTKGESNTSLVGEGIDSRDGSPSSVVEDETFMQEIPTSKSNGSGSEGKPPRAPNLLQPRPSPIRKSSSADRPAPITRNSSGEHARKRSTDDYSAMSGLTDDGGDDLDLSFRQNSVSWDKDVTKGVNDPGLSMPVFGEDTANPASTPPPPPPGRAKRNWGKLRDTIVIQETIENDMTVKTVNPLETEAETAILRALERTRRKNAAKAGNILPHVSVEAAEAFKQDTTPEQSNHSKNKSSGDDRSLFSGTAASAATSAAGNGAHKRTKTLDTTLFDLATKMHTLQNAPDGSIVGNRERVFSGDSATARGRFFSGDATAAEHKGNSGDVLVQNAAMLFRRPITKKESTPSNEDSLEVPPSPPGDNILPSNSSERRWSLINSQRSGDVNRKKMDDPIIEGVESIEFEDVEIGVEAGIGPPPDDAGESTPPGDAVGKKKKFRLGNAGKGARRMVSRKNHEVKEDFDTFRRFLQPRTGSIKFYLLFVIGFMIIPGIVVAAILFHSGNPGLGREGASTSWFILFLTRQIVTGTMAKATEVFVIDFLSLQLRLTVRLFGPVVTLLLVQAKGWPFIVFCWGIFNFAMNSGENVFAQHWLFWQSVIGLFNASNPSGTITFSTMNYKVNGIAVVVGFIVAIKRLWWGLYLGKRSYLHYGDELARVIKDMVFVSQVATWAKEIERHGKNAFKRRGFKSGVDLETLGAYHVSDFDLMEEHSLDELSASGVATSPDLKGKVIDEERIDKLTGSLSQSQRVRMTELLGRWEEPESVAEEQENVSIASILQFRQMLAYMDEDYPFSLAFGPADTREACVESAQNVYSRLLSLTPDKYVLPFDTLAVLAKNKDGDIDTDAMKELIRLFRPERNGDLTCLDFVKSCDEVYKEMRLLRASIANSGQIDHAFEVIVNVIFYVIMFIVIFVVLGWDPLALFVSISGIILAFAFMIGSASSKYFEGILFILVRRPYDIGDRIAISNPDSVLSTDGSATWFVQTVGLFSTTVRFAATNEVATLANGSLAASRVINAKRSPQANCYVYMKFSVDVPYSKVLIFKKAVESFVKERPREWLALNGFRATHADPERNYVEYIIVLGHRESWQNIGAILQSKADVASYCLEVSKKLDMRYIAPPLPVNLSMAQQNMQLVNTDQTSQKSGEAVPDLEERSTQSPMSPDVRAISALFGKRG